MSDFDAAREGCAIALDAREASLKLEPQSAPRPNILTQPTFKWLIISDKSGKFLGAIDMLGSGKAFLDRDTPLERLVDILNMRQPASNLADLPGFVPATDAARPSAFSANVIRRECRRTRTS